MKEHEVHEVAFNQKAVHKQGHDRHEHQDPQWLSPSLGPAQQGWESVGHEKSAFEGPIG
jgi:hypothetical protein